MLFHGPSEVRMTGFLPDRIKPSSKREWWFLAAGAALGAVVLVILGARYTIEPAGAGAPVAFLLDRWTGEVWRCLGTCGHQ